MLYTLQELYTGVISVSGLLWFCQPTWDIDSS